MPQFLGIDLADDLTRWAVVDGGRVLGSGEVASVAMVGDTAVAGAFGRLGEAAPIMVDGVPYGAEALVGRVLAAVVGEVRTRLGDVVGVALVHADDLDEYRRSLLVEAARVGEVAPVTLVPRSVAIAATPGSPGDPFAVAAGAAASGDPGTGARSTAGGVVAGVAGGAAIGVGAAAMAAGADGGAAAAATGVGPAGTPLTPVGPSGAALGPSGAPLGPSGAPLGPSGVPLAPSAAAAHPPVAPPSSVAAPPASPPPASPPPASPPPTSGADVPPTAGRVDGSGSGDVADPGQVEVPEPGQSVAPETGAPGQAEAPQAPESGEAAPSDPSASADPPADPTTVIPPPAPPPTVEAAGTAQSASRARLPLVLAGAAVAAFVVVGVVVLLSGGGDDDVAAVGPADTTVTAPVGGTDTITTTTTDAAPGTTVAAGSGFDLSVFSGRWFIPCEPYEYETSGGSRSSYEFAPAGPDALTLTITGYDHGISDCSDPGFPTLTLDIDLTVVETRVVDGIPAVVVRNGSDGTVGLLGVDGEGLLRVAGLEEREIPVGFDPLLIGRPG